jgi:pimeloyl-ACP methyl ester carboxylesterase
MRGRSLADPDVDVEHPLEALYVTGHSLGGAMAALFALTVCGNRAHEAMADRLRAVYTFGQPMAITRPLPTAVADAGTRLFRLVVAGDPVPALPPASFGPFLHFGQEYRFAAGEWHRSEIAVEQLANLRAIPRSLLAFLPAGNHRRRSRYSIARHAPDCYIAALRPAGRVTEFGD